VLANSSTAAYGTKAGNAYIHGWNNNKWWASFFDGGANVISSQVSGS